MIALSYRREDSLPIAGRLYDRLQAKFGKKNVFMDFDSIPPGVDFREQIKQTIERSNVVIVVIGPRWLGEQNDGSRRIDDPNDFVRLEIESALKRGIPVIPLLIDNTAMPKSGELPPDIEALAFRNALPLDSGIDFHTHTDRLILGIRSVASARTPPGKKSVAGPLDSAASWRGRQRSIAISIAIILVIATAGLAAWRFMASSPVEPQEKVNTDEIGAIPAPPTIAPSISPEPQATPSSDEGNVPAMPKTIIVPVDETTISAAMMRATKGDTIKVRAGTYEEGIVFKDGVILAGDGRDTVIVRCEASKVALGIRNCSSGSIAGVTFEHTGTTKEPNRSWVIGMENSSVEFFDCRVRKSGGFGILIRKAASPFLHDCEVEQNVLSGIKIEDNETNPVLKSNQCHHNGLAGISFSHRCNGVAEKNVCEANLLGVMVFAAGTAPKIEANTCQGNRMHGIQISSGAKGSYHANILEKNTSCGILVADRETMPTLNENSCRHNGMHGIEFNQAAGGTAKENHCEHNRNGISIHGKDTNPEISLNRLVNNIYAGLYIANAASPKIGENTISGNRFGVYRGK